MWRWTTAAAALAIAGFGSRARAQVGAENVAIVDVTSGSAVTAGAIRDLRAALQPSDRPIERESFRRALEDPLGPPADPLRAGRAALESARSAFTDLDLEAARSRLDEATEQIVGGALPREALEILAEVHLLRGRIEEADGGALAMVHLRAAARLAPARKGLDPGKFKPTLVSLYARAAAEPDRGTARMAIRVEPSDARISIDGGTTTRGSLTVSRVAAGPHVALVTHPGHAPRSVVIEASERTRGLVVALDRASDSERLIAARRALIEGGSTATAALAEIAAVTACPKVIAVKLDSSGRAVAASYSEAKKTLASWVAPGALTFRATAARAIASPAADDGRSTRTALDASPSPGDARPWYLGWQGAAAAGVTAAVVTTTLVLFLPRGRSYEVGGACFDQECP